MPPATNNLFAPEMAKNSPIETRTNKMAYCSKSPLPSSVNWTNRFQSISCPSTGGCSRASRLCVHPFDPLSAECGSHEWIRKILRFPRNLVVLELHDAHGVGRLAVICEDEFGDPKIAAANDSADRKALVAWLTGALVLYVASTAGAFAGLRIFQHRVLAIDAVLRFKIVGIGRRPMLIQCRTDLLISYCRIPFVLVLIAHLEPSIRVEGKCFRIGVYDSSRRAVPSSVP